MQRKILQLLFVCFVTVNAFGQGNITSTINPIAGDDYSFYIADTTGVKPGGGANAVWDFTNLKIDSSLKYERKYYAPLKTGKDTLLPTANIAASVLNIADFTFVNYYYIVNNSKIQCLGYVSDATLFKYDTIVDLIKYPYAFNNYYSFNFKASETTIATGKRVNGSGFCEVYYDSYGTLKMPFGTFTNVKRVANREYYFKSQTLMGIHRDRTTYTWYGSSSKIPLLEIVITQNWINKNPPNTSKYVNIPVQTITSIEHNNLIGKNNSIIITPNPVVDVFTIQTEANVKSVKIYNLVGQEVYSQVVNDANNISINLSAQPKGLYFAEVTTDGGKAVQKFIKE